MTTTAINILHISSILTAFDEKTVGTKVTNKDALTALVHDALRKNPIDLDKSGVLHLPSEAINFVSSGAGSRQDENGKNLPIEAFHQVDYRGRVQTFLKREYATPGDSVSALIYGRDCYLADEDTKRDEVEWQTVRHSKATHIWVAVWHGENARGCFRLVCALAGDNQDANKWTREEITKNSIETKEWNLKHCAVAD